MNVRQVLSFVACAIVPKDELKCLYAMERNNRLAGCAIATDVDVTITVDMCHCIYKWYMHLHMEHATRNQSVKSGGGVAAPGGQGLPSTVLTPPLP